MRGRRVLGNAWFLYLAQPVRVHGIFLNDLKPEALPENEAYCGIGIADKRRAVPR